MSYQVLARKWRPQAFDDVLGQRHVTDVLKNMLTTGRLHHGYLFAGIRGIGKTTTARILAKALNCVHGPTPDPCNQCEFCREITDGYSIDVEEIDGASNRGVDDVRILQDNAGYAPSRSRYKVFIIDEAHMLTTEAFNALLKIMEEPPANVVFILATTESWKVPVTILSRCQQFTFQKSTPDEAFGLLRKIAGHEGITISDASLNLIIKTAGGSVRDAENLFDQAIGFSGNVIADEDVRHVLGIADAQLLRDTVLALIQRQTPATFSIMERLVNRGYNLRLFCMEVLERLRNMMVLKIARHPDPYLVLFDYGRAELERYALHTTLSELQQWYWLMSKAEREITFSPQPRFLLEMALANMANVQALEPLDDLSAQLDELRAEIGAPEAAIFPQPQPSQTPQPQPIVYTPPVRRPEPDAVAEPFTFAAPAVLKRAVAPLQHAYPPPSPELLQTWEAIIEAIKPKRRGLIPILRKAVPLELTNSVLTLGFHADSEFARNQLDAPNNAAIIGETVKTLWGYSVHVRTTMYADAPSTQTAQERLAQERPVPPTPEVPAQPYTPPGSARPSAGSARTSADSARPSAGSARTSMEKNGRKSEWKGDRKEGGSGEWKGRDNKSKPQYKAPVQVSVNDIVRMFEGEVEE